MIRAAVVSLAAISLVACKASPEGTYKLDKAATKKVMEADIATKPKDDQEMAKLGLAIIEQMEMSFTLKPEGKLEITASMPSFEKAPPKTETETGTWRKEGDNIFIKTAKAKDETQCALASGKLSCKSAAKTEPAFVLVKS